MTSNAQPPQAGLPGQAASSGVPAGPTPAWTLDMASLPAHLRPALPVMERDYFAFWRAPRFRWWKSLLAIALGVARRLAQRQRPAASPAATQAPADTNGTGVAHV